MSAQITKLKWKTSQQPFCLKQSSGGECCLWKGSNPDSYAAYESLLYCLRHHYCPLRIVFVFHEGSHVVHFANRGSKSAICPTYDPLTAFIIHSSLLVLTALWLCGEITEFNSLISVAGSVSYVRNVGTCCVCVCIVFVCMCVRESVSVCVCVCVVF